MKFLASTIVFVFVASALVNERIYERIANWIVPPTAVK